MWVRGSTCASAGLSWAGLPGTLQEAGQGTPRLQGGSFSEGGLGESEVPNNRSFIHSTAVGASYVSTR